MDSIPNLRTVMIMIMMTIIILILLIMTVIVIPIIHLNSEFIFLLTQQANDYFSQQKYKRD